MIRPRSTLFSLVAMTTAPAACGNGTTATFDAGTPDVNPGSTPCDGGMAAPVDAGSKLADAGSKLADAASPGPPVVVTLASGGGNGMATDGTNVFWAGSVVDGGAGIWTVPVDGGAVSLLAAIPAGTGANPVPYAVALGATTVYWTVSHDFANDGGFQTSILGTPRGGGPTTVLLAGQQVTTGLALDDTSIYWGNGGPAGESAVMKMPLNGGAATTLASGLTLPAYGGGGGEQQTIAVDSTSVYWASTGSIMKVPLSCGMPESLAPAGEVGAIAVAATGVYWTQLDSPDVGPASVRTMPFGGSEVSTIASYPGDLTGGVPIAVDATNVYWPISDPSCGESCIAIARAPLAGGPSSTLVTGLVGFPTQLAVDDTSVYWTAQGPTSAIEKVTSK